MATLVHYTYTVPLSGLADWSAFLYRATFVDPVNSMGPMEGTTWKACMGLKFTSMIVRHLLHPLTMFGSIAGTSGIHR